MRFKTRIDNLRRQIEKQNREKKKLSKQEERSRKTWTKSFCDYMKAVDALRAIKIHGTKKEAALWAKTEGWTTTRSAELTRERDNFRAKLKGADEILTKLSIELAMLLAQQISNTRAADEVVAQVFTLNEMVVRAARDRNDYLCRHIFPHLIYEKGKLLSQVTFDSADGLRRVVAMVNTMTIVRSDMALRATSLIQTFFDRFQREVEMDSATRALYELTHQLLVEKTSFKIGPDLHRFLAMEIDSDIFSELAEAQQLLRLSIHSEKTNSYIRLYQRKSRTDNWEVVPQS